MATHMSEGLVAMQCSLVPRIARVRLLSAMAGHPLLGSRLLHGIAVSRKNMQRVRWSRLPATVAMLRTCAEAPCRMACDRTERSEEHTSELQSQSNLVCRLLLAKKNR